MDKPFEQPQIVVPENAWQGTRICEPLYGYSFLGPTVPGFEFVDFEMATLDSVKNVSDQLKTGLMLLVRNKYYSTRHWTKSVSKPGVGSGGEF